MVRLSMPGNFIYIIIVYHNVFIQRQRLLRRNEKAYGPFGLTYVFYYMIYNAAYSNMDYRDTFLGISEHIALTSVYCTMHITLLNLKNIEVTKN